MAFDEFGRQGFGGLGAPARRSAPATTAAQTPSGWMHDADQWWSQNKPGYLTAINVNPGHEDGLQYVENPEFRSALGNFLSTKSAFAENNIARQQAYNNMLGNGQMNGMIGANYSDPNFGQVTGQVSQPPSNPFAQPGANPASDRYYEAQRQAYNNMLGNPGLGLSLPSYGKALNAFDPANQPNAQATPQPNGWDANFSTGSYAPVGTFGSNWNVPWGL